jgi:hypothetical protein
MFPEAVMLVQGIFTMFHSSLYSDDGFHYLQIQRLLQLQLQTDKDHKYIFNHEHISSDI